jgi:DNA-binding SARP family transcriptional activator
LAVRATLRTPPIPNAAAISLTGEFSLLVADRTVGLPHAVERLLALLALARRPMSRLKIAGTLWIDASEPRAASNLRTALWRLHRNEGRIVDSSDERLGLAPDVYVDHSVLVATARRLIEGPDEASLARLPGLVSCEDLLPDWDDDWVVADRERFRLLRLEALERAADVLVEQGRCGQAMEAALAATISEPTRESARRTLLRVYLAEGNTAEAVRSFESYRDLLREEMGLEPSAAMRDLVQSQLAART